MEYDKKYRDRKFILSMIPMLAGTAALFLEIIAGQDYYLLVLAILGGYAWNKKVETNVQSSD